MLYMLEVLEGLLMILSFHKKNFKGHDASGSDNTRLLDSS